MASQKPNLPQATPDEDGQQTTGRPPLVRKLDLKALHQPQGPTTGINAIIGKWPGDESDEEILAYLEELS